MKILGMHLDVCHLGGHTRLFLMLMDVFKSIGHEVEIVHRMGGGSEAEVEAPILDPRTARPLLLPAKIRVSLDAPSHTLSQMKNFQPIRHLAPQDFVSEPIPIIRWGDRFLHPWPEKVKEKIRDSDLLLTDTEMYVRMEEDLDIAGKHVQYVHFPTQETLPVYGKEPLIWCNSSFTRSWIRIRWGYDNPRYTKIGRTHATMKIPNQVYNAEIVHPPLYVEDYENSMGFKDRSFDVVMFARLGEDKFTVAKYLDEHFNLLSLGAQRSAKRFNQLVRRVSPGAKQVDLNLPKKETFKPYKPKGKLHRNLKFREIKRFLSTAKVYVHGKGFGISESGEASEPEHFGLTVCEAAASGCAIVVPRTGGCWTDIAQFGKYGLGYSSLQELSDHISYLIKDESCWMEWSKKALEGVQRFDVKYAKRRIKELLSK